MYPLCLLLVRWQLCHGDVLLCGDKTLCTRLLRLDKDYTNVQAILVVVTIIMYLFDVGTDVKLPIKYT